MKTLADKMELGERVTNFEVWLVGHNDKNYPDRKVGTYPNLADAQKVDKGE